MAGYGIDTSILVRLLTGEPEADYQRTVSRLETLQQSSPGARVTAANIVIGEAYFVLQHHYGFSAEDSREALGSVLSSGLVVPLAGDGVLEALRSHRGAGLMDRLIQMDYGSAGAVTLTHDAKMARLPDSRRL